MTDTDTIGSKVEFFTAALCGHAALFGGPLSAATSSTWSGWVWDDDDTLGALSEVFRILAQGVAAERSQVFDEREEMLWGFVNMLESRIWVSVATPTR